LKSCRHGICLRLFLNASIIFLFLNHRRPTDTWQKALRLLPFVCELVAGVFLGFAGGFGVTGGVHRLWTHRSYKAKWPLRVILALCYSVSGQVHISFLHFLLSRIHFRSVPCKYSETCHRCDIRYEYLDWRSAHFDTEDMFLAWPGEKAKLIVLRIFLVL
jgi:hypothetical protein